MQSQYNLRVSYMRTFWKAQKPICCGERHLQKTVEYVSNAGVAIHGSALQTLTCYLSCLHQEKFMH